MRFIKALSNSMIASTLVLAQSTTWAISKEMHALVRMETKSNAVSTRDSDALYLENYEIPLELVERSVALRSNPKFVESMIFERGGKKFVRWLINPEDTKWHLEVEKLLKENNLSTQRHKHFAGYKTASRSYIAVDPKTGAEFSIKMSTDKTGGNWRDKKQTWEDASQIRMMTDFVDAQVRKQPKLQNIILLDEAMAFGLKGIDQGMVIRSYEALTKSGNRYVPGFSIMHENLGVELARANGSHNPAEYWNEHYNKPLARAIAEFFALTGMTYDSPHGQNFLVELDSKNRPTGKIVLRDFGDTYLLENFFNAVKRTDIHKGWELDNVKKGRISVAVGILHGNKAPNWMDMSTASDGKNINSYNRWGTEFYQAFDAEIKRQTGLEIPHSEMSRSGEYMQRTYFFDNPAGGEFLRAAAMNQQRDHLLVKSCGRALFAM